MGAMDDEQYGLLISNGLAAMTEVHAAILLNDFAGHGVILPQAAIEFPIALTTGTRSEQ